jgi:hypothetical protein
VAKELWCASPRSSPAIPDVERRRVEEKLLQRVRPSEGFCFAGTLRPAVDRTSQGPPSPTSKTRAMGDSIERELVETYGREGTAAAQSSYELLHQVAEQVAEHLEEYLPKLLTRPPGS